MKQFIEYVYMLKQIGGLCILRSKIVINFDPQDSKVVIPLLVQLMGEDRWLRVRISCPLVRRISNQAGLIPTRE